MAVLHPFRAVRPSPAEVNEISCPPYDVINTQEAREMAKNNPKSFLHITKPEVDLSAGTPFNDPAAYQKGADNLQQFIENGILSREKEPAVYIYQLNWKDKTQTGIFGCVSVDDYNNDVILKHERTRPDKEDDRTRHITAQQAHAEPVMLTFNDSTGVGDTASKFCENNDPIFDFTADDGVTHRLWSVVESDHLVEHFAQLQHLYIADGHHRCKAASRAAAEMQNKHPGSTSDAEYNYFPAVIFPMSEMNILSYNRLVHHINDDFPSQLKDSFHLQECNQSSPGQKGEVCLYFEGKWHLLQLPVADNASAVEKLDAHRLQEFILEPYFDISDPRRDENISFVGGIKGTKELEKRVDEAKADLAISMYPTSIEELVQVSDEKLLMPPKSTWFEPKLRSGLLVHTF